MALTRRGKGPAGRKLSKMRRELRTLKELREEELRHLGGLALEMHRRDRVDVDLLMKRADELAGLEDEIREIGTELDAAARPGGGLLRGRSSRKR